MTAFLAFLLGAPPDLSELSRFPTPAQVNAQLAALIGVRYQLHQAPPSREREQALHENARQLRAWELLHVAHGGVAEEEDGDASDETRRDALGRLKEMLAPEDWRRGRMP